MKRVRGYPGVSEAHLAVALNYSNTHLLGPPVCQELISLVEHMYTEEEAQIVRHVKPMRVRTAVAISGKSGRPYDEVKRVLDRLAHERHVILSFGKGDRERYLILPLVPGTFEMTMMRPDPDTVTDWNRRFASLFEELFSTGYITEYMKKPTDSVRYLPVGEVIPSLPQALPSDRLEVILDRYDHFGIAACQCRLLQKLNGNDCGRMLEVCTVVGDYVPTMVERGFLKSVSKKDVLAIKAAAEKEGLVTWMVNEESGKYTSALCSCCGCCCGALRTVTEFNAPGLIAPPHFMPRIDEEKCTLCESCAQVCPMGALIMTGEGDESRLIHKTERCIGCGLCAVACPTDALEMREVPDYRKPPSGWGTYFARYFPAVISNWYGVWSSRRRG